METIYIACVAIGIAVPLLSLVFNLFDGFVDFISLDFFHLDLGDFTIDFLPFSINSLCMWALIYGGCGLALEDKLITPVVTVIGLGAGYVCAVLLQTMIKRLKKVETLAEEEKGFLFKTGYIANKIPEGGVGAVSLKTDSGSTISYPAISFDGKELLQDKEVEIIEFRESFAVVRSKKYLEEKYKD